MHALSAPELLGVWERGLVQQPIHRAIALLAAACPETPPETLAKLSIGQRDAGLLTLRELTFGLQAVGLAVCPECGETLELNFDLADIRVPPPTEPWAEDTLRTVEYEVCFRLPNSMDLAAINGQTDLEQSRQLLLKGCVLSVRHRGREASSADLPAEIMKALVDRMAEADSQADVQVALFCTTCGHHWQAFFDIASFFWAEIHAWACRVLLEVHRLASAYGWQETEILMMNPLRRQFYLEMAGG